MKSVLFWMSLIGAAVLSINLYSVNPTLSTDVDEEAWVFSSYWYRLAFIKHDLTSPEWKHADLIDHPPLEKIVLGAFLNTKDLVPDSIKPKEFWFEHGFDRTEGHQFRQRLAQLVSPEALFLGRLWSTVFMFSSFVLLVAVSRRVFSPAVAVLSGFLFLAAPLVRFTAGQVAGEGLFNSVLWFVLLAQIMWASRYLAGRRSSLAWVLAAGVGAGLLGDFKISGFALIPVALASMAGVICVGKWKKSSASVGLAATGMGAFLLTSLLTAWLFNPALYRDPIAFLAEMLRHRSEVLQLQTVVFYGEAFPHFPGQILGFARRLFLRQDPVYQVTYVPVILFLFTLGVWKLVRQAKAQSVAALIFGIYALAWIALGLLFFKMAWDRYLLYALPFVAVLAAAGIQALFDIPPQSSRALRFTVMVSVLVSVLAGSHTVVDLFKRTEAEQLVLKSQFSEYLLKRHPTDPALPGQLESWWQARGHWPDASW